MNYAIDSLAQKFIVGIAVRTSNLKAAQDIPALWQQFHQTQVFQRITNKKSNYIFALYCDYEGDYTKPYTCLIGCEVTSTDHIPQDMVIKETPKSMYVVFKSQGEFPAELIKTWHAIWQAPLNRTYTGDFELYAPNFDPIENPEVDVYIAVKK